MIGKNSPGIIFIHGLNSDMNGLKALSIEKYAKKNKLSFIRFDCRGHGKSFGKFEDFTISDWKEDLINIIDHLSSGPQILIGSSLGGWLMILATKLRSNRIAGLIGIAAATDFGDNLYKNLTKENKNQLKKNGMAQYSSFGFSYCLKSNFFIDAKKNNILTKKFNYKKPLILIHGLKDIVVSKNMPEKIMNITSGKKVELIYLKSSDHRMSGTRDLIIINDAIDSIRNQI